MKTASRLRGSGALVLTLCALATQADDRVTPSTPKVVFTFDVSSRWVYERTLPIFSERGMPAVVYAETAQMNSGESWVMSWKQLQDLQNVHGWEVGSHTVNHPYLTELDDQQLNQELKASKTTLSRKGLTVRSFASPYGNYDLRVIAAAAKYYDSHRAAWGGPNVWPDVYNDYELRCYEISNTTTVTEVEQWVEDAIASGHTLVLLMHEIVTGEPQMYEYREDDLKAILDYVATRPIRVTTMSSALQYSTSANLVANPSFTNATDGWAKDWTRTDGTNITLDGGGHGNVSGPSRSVKIVGGDEQRELTSKAIAVSGSARYVVRMFQNVQDLSAGGWAVWIDERDSQGGWLSGQWLGGNWEDFVGYRYYAYTPTSMSVAQVNLTIYAEAGSQLTLYVDSVELRETP